MGGIQPLSVSAVEVLAAAVERDLGTDPSRWFHPPGYESVALAVLDSIYSTGNRYAGVIHALNRYRTSRRAEGDDPDQDGAIDLVAAVDRWGGTGGLVERTNRWRTSTKAGAPSKAEAAYGAATILADHGLDSVAQVREALGTRDKQHESPVKTRWLALPGQRSGLTWTYFLMLCGVPGVKADRMVVSYVSRAFGQSASPEAARSLVCELARTQGIDEIVLDHAIWRLESAREVFVG